MTGELAVHMIRVQGNVTAVRERIERVLGVKTDAFPDRNGWWGVEFLAPKDADLDFLRPDVLPPL